MKEEILEEQMDGQTELVAAAPAKTEEGTLLNLIAKMATDPQADMNKLERLISLRDHVLNQEAKKLYDADFVLMKPELPLVIKLHDNTQTRSKYAKLEDINQKIDPILGKYGFGTSAKVIAQTDTSVSMRLEVKHRGGHTEAMELTFPIDDKGLQGSVNKTKIHGISSTIQYMKRVGFCAMLNISTGDDRDGNQEAAGADTVISTDNAVEIDLRATALEKSNPGYRLRFLKWAQVERADQILERHYKKCLNALSTAEAEAKKNAGQQPKANETSP
jgi:hypothetical protein